MAGVWLAVRGVLLAAVALAAGVVKVMAGMVVVIGGWLWWLLRRGWRFGLLVFRGGRRLLRRDGWLRGTALRDKMRGLSSGGAAVRRVKRLMIFAAGLLVAFWLGAVYSSSPHSSQGSSSSNLHSSSSSSGTLPDVESLDNEVRGLAMAQIAHSLENEELRAQLALRDAEIAKLTDENRDLINDVLRRDETILTYRQIIDATGGDMVIHALAQDPGFAPGRRRLSAVLVRAKRGKFKGAYYFEIVGVDNGVEKVSRAPQKPAKLNFERYREITETIDLSDDARIKKMRLIVTDAKNKIIAIDELVFGGGEDNGNNGNNNNGENNNGKDGDDVDGAPANEVE